MGQKQPAVPVDAGEFSAFIEQSGIFGRTRRLMEGYLASWYRDAPEQFIEEMRAGLDEVLEQYHFYDTFVSITKNFNFEPPMDTVSCTIRIKDAEDVVCASYTAVFDCKLEVLDDYLEG